MRNNKRISLRQIFSVASFVGFLFFYSFLAHAKSGSSYQTMNLRYEQSLIQNGFSSPVIEVQLNSAQKGIFLIDTGAATHVVASWFADAHLSKSKESLSVPDSTGNIVKVTIARADLKVGKFKQEKQMFLVSDLPEEFQRHGIAGIISPQALGETVAIDFKTAQLFVAGSSEDLKKNFGLKLFPKDKLLICVTPVSRLYVAEVEYLGKAVKLLIDSGSATTKIFAGSKVGKELSNRAAKSEAKTSGLSGVSVDLLKLPAGKIQIDHMQIPSEVYLQNSDIKGCPSDGLLGQNILQKCILMMIKDEVAISCDLQTAM